MVALLLWVLGMVGPREVSESVARAGRMSAAGESMSGTCRTRGRYSVGRGAARTLWDLELKQTIKRDRWQRMI